ncbi:alpha/beta hydrolase fold domain-containing protein [candidate division KSB1 bacterium]|nr:alpha/beta hydrolase fold domain-containing protein [candidate division KSB1 bacterium]
MRTSSICILMFFLFPSHAFCQTKPDELILYKVIEDVELYLHVFYPDSHAASDQRSAIVFFFGGSWRKWNPTQFYPQSLYLAQRGMIAVCAEYRTENKHHTSPIECVKDGKSAIRWIRTHAGELGIDPMKLVAGGGSAGGHLAVAASFLKGFNEASEDTSIDCRPDALVLFNPVIDNSSEGYGYERVQDYWQKFSPLHNVSKPVPPSIIFLGTKDELIPVTTMEKFQKQIIYLGGRCDLLLFDGESHGFFNHSKYEETLLATEKFLISLGYLQCDKKQANFYIN